MVIQVLSLFYSVTFASGFLPSLRVKGFHYPLRWPLGGSVAEKVLENPKWPTEWPYSEDDFYRQDESNDGIFYGQARL